jgi:PST family polysaccharide transporter
MKHEPVADRMFHAFMFHPSAIMPPGGCRYDGTMPDLPDRPDSFAPLPAAASVDLFGTDHLRADLRSRSVRGGAMMMMAQGASFTLNLVSVAVLARLLAPSDFGLIAMVTAITGFVGMFKDAGLSMATVQRDHVTHEQISTLFWINLVLSLLLVGVVAALAPAIARFYGQPRLFWIALAVGGTFLISGLTIQHQALLQRQMRFGILAGISVTAMGTGVAAAITSAALGAGYWALVIQVVAQLTVTAAGVWIACRWRPGRPVRGAGVRPMLAFGGHLTGFSLLNYLARNADDMLIGRYWGAGPLGFYSKAYQILLLPILQLNTPMSSVALPALSRLQGEPERFKAFYHTAIGLLVFLGMPLVAFLFVEARPVVLLVLGPKWEPSVAIFQALGVAAFMGTFNVAGGWVYIALGRTDRQLTWAVVSVPVTLAAFAVGLRWGAVGVALGFSASQLLLFPFAILFCYRGTFLRARELAATLVRPALASIGAAAGLWAVQRAQFSFDAVWKTIVVGWAIYVVLYALLWVAMPGGLARIRDYISLVRAPRRPGDAQLISKV